MALNPLSLSKKINIPFKDHNLLVNVFVHRSYLNEHKNFYLPSNERLEFLGDSVLSLITSVYLFRKFPYLEEGDYTEIKSAVVKTDSLATSAQKLGLSDYLLLSKGEEKSGGRNNKNILADSFEALIGAIFLDRSFEEAYRFVCEHLFEKRLDFIVKNKQYLPSKSKLQELIQAKFKMIPQYKVIEQTGPEHRRTFKVGVFFNGKKLGEGTAKSKKEAEEEAAKKAFENLDRL